MTAFEDRGDDVDELRPLGDEAEFAELVKALVADTAPCLFALVEECGERADGWIVAWGMQFEDHAEVVAADRGLRISVVLDPYPGDGHDPSWPVPKEPDPGKHGKK